MLNLSAWSEMIDTRNRSYGTDIVHGVVLSPNRPRKASLGNLKAFPREILDEVLMFLDLDALRAVRQLNRTYFSVATNLPAYKILREHASEVLQIMHMTRTARFFNIYRIFDEFCQPYCRTCGDFGPCVFLIGLYPMLRLLSKVQRELHTGISFRCVRTILSVCERYKRACHYIYYSGKVWQCERRQAATASC